MAKVIVPLKLVIEMEDDGTFKNGVLLYRRKIDGATDMRKTYSIAIKNGIQLTDMAKILGQAKAHADLAEGV